MPIFVDWLNVRCIIFTSEKVRIWWKKYPREYRIVYYQFPPLIEYPHLLRLEEILGSSGILRADLGFAVLSLFFVISYRYNIKMGVEAEILAQPKFHYFCIDFGFEKGNLTVSILQIMTVMILSTLSTPSFHFQICPTQRRCLFCRGHQTMQVRIRKSLFLSAKDFQTGLQQMTKTVNHQLGMHRTNGTKR